MRVRNLLALVVWSLVAGIVQGDVTLPAIFSDHMVLQRERENRIWGRAEPGERVNVTIADQRHATTTDPSGHWHVMLSPLPAGGPHSLVVSGKNTLTISDVLVGEVWVCSGQSNMELSLEASNDGDLVKLLPSDSRIRMITVPHVGTQLPQEDFDGRWEICSPATSMPFSAVGYYFGKHLADTLDVPVGLIDDSWGGSACEAWIDRNRLASHERFQGLVDAWSQFEKSYDYDKELAEYEKQLAAWEAGDKKSSAPWRPGNHMEGNSRPGNLFCGMIAPVAGYGIRGVIWYQGETNAGRAYQYRDMFPLMIQNWRDQWKIGDFPFYWVQLADFMGEADKPSESGWAELREAQTMTLDKLPNVGQAVIIDLGEGKDIHPRNKHDVALRLARLALARDYGKDLVDESPRYHSMEVQGSKAVVTFAGDEPPLGNLRTFDVAEPVGFTIAGHDRKFVVAQAKLIGPNQVEVWSDNVAEPVAVRYAWADNPICNLKNEAGLPAVPFRTDDWPGVTATTELPPHILPP